ncbi:MAG: hypothetical protein F4X17_12105 [Gemmatimonadetes bacterium]|nr:hypothetical protein [Gemmatimonadota bacterium]
MAKIEKLATAASKAEEITDHELKALIEEAPKARVVGKAENLELCIAKDDRKEDSYFFSISLVGLDIREFDSNDSNIILFRPTEKTMLSLAQALLHLLHPKSRDDIIVDLLYSMKKLKDGEKGEADFPKLDAL